MKEKIIDIQPGEACPGDELMSLYRKKPEELRKHVLFSQSSIDFFKSMADVVDKKGRILTFFWDTIPEEELPSLKIKLQKKGKNYELIYLKEKVTFEERQNEFKGRVTLNINQSKLRKQKPGKILLRKKEIEKEREQ